MYIRVVAVATLESWGALKVISVVVRLISTVKAISVVVAY